MQNSNTHACSQRIPRRAMLRGAGITLALPILESLVRPTTAATVDDPDGRPMRMLIISNNLGVLPFHFFPESSGIEYEASNYLSVLQQHRQDFTVFSGLSHPGVIGGHSTENCLLTAAPGPTRSGFRQKISLDQYAAEQLGQQTRFPSLNLGVNIDRANRSLSWTRDGSLLPAEDSPRRLFQKMFVQGSPDEIRARLHELRQRKSILDTLLADTMAAKKLAGQQDRRRLEQYFTSIRELEERLHIAGEWEKRPLPVMTREPPEDIEGDSRFFDKFELMLSMAQLALESDSTRIVTLMVDAFATGIFEIDEQTRSINAYHNLSHHGHVPEKVAQLKSVDLRQMKLLDDVLTKLANTPEAGQRLLDRTMLMYGSNMGDSNTHDNTNLPILLAGGGFRHGHHLQFDHDNNTPLSNLYVNMLQRLGVEADQFGTSTGSLGGLELA